MHQKPAGGKRERGRERKSERERERKEKRERGGEREGEREGGEVRWVSLWSVSFYSVHKQCMTL
jgi:hypothetical protein